MFTGTTIDELIHTVERAEQQACVLLHPPKLTAVPRDLAAFTYVYEFFHSQQVVIGVA